MGEYSQNSFRSSGSTIGVCQRMEEMQKHLEEMEVLKSENAPTLESATKVRKIVEDCKSIVEDGGAPEMIIDGRIISCGGSVIKHCVQQFDASLRRFNANEYASELLSFLRDNSDMGETDWDTMAEHTFSLIHKVPSLHFKLGTFKLDPPPTPEKPKSQRTKNKLAESTKTVAKSLVENDQPTEITDGIYGHILKCLFRCYRKNANQPVNFFQFILDPNSFNQSVLNAFHFAFLVRDVKVNLFVNDKGLPVVEPILTKAPLTNKIVKKRQFFNKMSPVEYQRLLKTFHVTQTCIPPFVAKK